MNTSETKTPRTDAEEFRAYTTPDNSSRACVSADFARTLERELNAVEKERNELRAQLEQEKKWKTEDPWMLREQIRVADAAFNRLCGECKTLRAQLQVAKEALTELTEPKGAFRKDPLEHCRNIIEDSIKVAKTALAQLDAEKGRARRDADGHCTVCGLEWPDERLTLEPHVCPPGFTNAEKGKANE